MQFRRHAIGRTALLAAFVVALGAGTSLAQQTATTVQLPTFGVSIDAEGVLSVKAFPDPTGQLRKERAAAAEANLAQDLRGASKLRKISLRRLEAALAERLKQGQEPDDVMRHLAGLQRVQFVFFYPEQNDIVLAGPAESWMEDLAGRAVGVESNQPTLLLEDLAVALRAFPPDAPPTGFVGCTIDPNAEGLARLQEFQRKVPRSVRSSEKPAVAQAVAQGTREALGQADVRVFGIPADTHFAQVLVEADYLMKLIGIGLERPPVKLESYLDRLTASTANAGTLQRWWFTPNYEGVKLTDDRLAMELVGQGVQLQTEDKAILPGGMLAAKAKPNAASVYFTAAFTKKFPELAARQPVFRQLRNLIDLLIASAFIQQEGFYEQAEWDLGALGDEEQFAVRGQPTPKKAPCAVNSVWKGARLYAPAGGGVDIQPQLAFKPAHLLSDTDRSLASRHEALTPREVKGWWWD
jgi:hypothetical protein